MIQFFFFKQKTAYEMRISDWSSDVCSSDLAGAAAGMGRAERRPAAGGHPALLGLRRALAAPAHRPVPARRLGPPAGQPGVPADLRPAVRTGDEIGRASCRERVCQYV